MPGACSICLSSFKKPVCIPCGHIYCKQCLIDFVNSPGNESLKASCPTCRAQFNLSTPDLTYLPKKYHEYIIPSLRRVYLDSSCYSDMQKDLKASKEKIKKLERDRDTLMKQCEKHMAAAQAQAEGERAARLKASDLQSKLHIMQEDFRAAGFNERSVKKAYSDLRSRYEKLRARQDLIDARTSMVSIPKGDLSVSTPSASRLEFVREVRHRPPPACLKSKARPASPSPVYVNKRQRVFPTMNK